MVSVKGVVVLIVLGFGFYAVKLVKFYEFGLVSEYEYLAVLTSTLKLFIFVKNVDMIKRLIVKNLNYRFDFDLTFHRDLNILVGQNGCGKTSLLKLMWYVYSGNIYRFGTDVTFDEVWLETFEGNTIEFQKNKGVRKGYDDDELFTKVNNELTVIFNPIGLDRFASKTDETFDITKIENKIATNNSIFMPTHRRVEGGFNKTNSSLSNALEEVSNSLNTYHKTINSDRIASHKFVTSLSTNDIVNVVTAKYSDISQELRKIEEAQSEFILKNTNNGKGAETALKDIQAAVKANDEKRKEILNAMTVLSNLVTKIIKNKEIQLTEKLTLGTGEKINPDQLSFGEKQMLSFLCYNFFADDTIIFIDEPEMSFHGDWQRILFPVLMQQNTSNQFIVTSHSPFIYAQYQDKQIILTQQETVTA